MKKSNFNVKNFNFTEQEEINLNDFKNLKTIDF